MYINPFLRTWLPAPIDVCGLFPDRTLTRTLRAKVAFVPVLDGIRDCTPLATPDVETRGTPMEADHKPAIGVLEWPNGERLARDGGLDPPPRPATSPGLTLNSRQTDGKAQRAGQTFNAP
jgi:hypothetical protein